MLDVCGPITQFLPALFEGSKHTKATVAESVDVADLKSVACKGVPVRVRPVALFVE